MKKPNFCFLDIESWESKRYPHDGYWLLGKQRKKNQKNTCKTHKYQGVMEGKNGRQVRETPGKYLSLNNFPLGGTE